MEGQSEWTLFGSKFSRTALVFLCQVIILYISIITCFINLTVHNGPNKLWITVLSLSLGTLLPSPKVRKSKIAAVAGGEGGGGGVSNSGSVSGTIFGKIYFDPSHPGSFKGANKLHKAIKDEGKYTIPLNKVK